MTSYDCQFKNGTWHKNYSLKFLYALILSVLIGNTAIANDNKSVASTAKQPLGVVLDQYATIAGGWYLNEKCDFLSSELKKEFEAYVANCTIKLNQKVNIEFDFLQSLQRSGRAVAYSDQYPCASSETNDAVVKVFVMAKQLSNKLNLLSLLHFPSLIMLALKVLA